jgi:hypothetical protein
MAAFQSAREIRRKWKTQVRTVRLHMNKAATFNFTGKAAAGGFDFRQFRHDAAEPTEAGGQALWSRHHDRTKFR